MTVETLYFSGVWKFFCMQILTHNHSCKKCSMLIFKESFKGGLQVTEK